MIDSIKGTLKKYADFSGTATRKEYWTFYLFYLVAMFLSGFIGGLLGFNGFSTLVLLALLSPLIACGARRNHDVGKSGWFMLVPLYNLVLLLSPTKVTSLEQFHVFESIQFSLKRATDFSGKSGRRELLYLLAMLYAPPILDALIPGFIGSLISLIGGVIGIFLIIPTLACAVRRMHDVGKSGWFVLIPIYNLVLLLSPSK